MPEIELKPCPFCGGTDLDYYVDNFVSTYVECNTCGVKRRKGKADNVARQTNRRADNG